MAFCINCGQELAEGAKFCANCGKAVNDSYSKEQRKTVYDGELHKCPNCGEVLDSFEVNCPTCGHEFRGAKNSISVREFAAKLEEIERARPTKGLGIKKMFENPNEVNETDLKKISLIRSYVIPNTKEDMLEFLILASSNINPRRYNDFDYLSQSEKAVSDAWQAKFEQAYEKAKLSFGDTTEFKKIQAIYDKKNREINREIKKSKKKNTYFWIGFATFFVVFFVVFGGIIFGMASYESKAIAAENERLDAVVEQVYDALKKDNFVLARAKAASLVFSGPDNDEAEIAADKWVITRQQLLDIIDKAEYGVNYVSVPQEIRIGASHDDLKNMDYLQVKKQLENCGFTNIKTEAVESLLIGWWIEEGTIDKVLIGGDLVFSEDSVYSSDTEIIIYYYAKQ